MPEMTMTVAEELTRAIVALPDVDDCCVVERGEWMVAYVVASGYVSSDEMTKALLADAPDRRVPDAFVPVATLPLTADGDVDVAALAEIELIDAELLAKAEAQIADVTAAGHAAFVVETDALPLPPLHLADVFPEWKRAGGAKNEVRAKPVVSTAVAEVAGAPALCVGEPLRETVVRNLPAALRRAVDEAGENGLLYIQEDEREISQTYSELLADAERILGALRGLGAKPQDRFLFQFKKNQDFIPAFWACQLGGFVPVPISIAPTYEQPNATISKLHNAWLMLDKPWILTDHDLSAVSAGTGGAI